MPALQPPEVRQDYLLVQPNLLGIFGNVKGIIGLNIHATDRHLLILQLSLAEATMIAQALTNFVKAAGGIDVSESN